MRFHERTKTYFEPFEAITTDNEAHILLSFRILWPELIIDKDLILKNAAFDFFSDFFWTFCRNRQFRRKILRTRQQFKQTHLKNFQIVGN